MGKKVSIVEGWQVGPPLSRDVFDRLGIKADEVNLGQADALEKLKSAKLLRRYCRRQTLRRNR